MTLPRFLTFFHSAKSSATVSVKRSNVVSAALFAVILTEINAAADVLRPSGSNGNVPAFFRAMAGILEKHNVSEEAFRDAVSKKATEEKAKEMQRRIRFARDWHDAPPDSHTPLQSSAEVDNASPDSENQGPPAIP